MQQQALRRFLARIILGAFCCIFIASCAASLETVMSGYHGAKVSCNGYQEFGYERLEMPDKKIFWLDENSKVFAFDSGKSYFKAFELPKYSSPYSILIKSYTIGGSFKYAYILSPAIMFLDERFAVTRFTEKGVFQYTSTSFFDLTVLDAGGLVRVLEAEIPVTQENANDRYMVILTTDELLKENEVFVRPGFVPIIVPGVVGAIPTGRVDTDFIPHSPIGKLKVVVRPKAGD